VVTVFPALLLAQAVTMPAALEVWLEDIARLSSSRLVVLEVDVKPGQRTIPLPANRAHYALLGQDFVYPPTVAHIAETEVTTIAHRESSISFVVVNTALLKGEAEREAAIAHEFGHLWMRASGYPTPQPLTGPAACLTTAAEDIAGHPLIRKEMTRRGIPWLDPWVGALTPALAAMEQLPSNQPSEPRCRALSQVSLYIDVSLNLTAGMWPARQHFLEVMDDRYPVSSRVARDLLTALGSFDLSVKAAHRKALQFVFAELKSFALTIPE